MPFSLHQQLADDSIVVGDLPLCRVLLMNNVNFPWLVMVPRRDNMREMFELSQEDYKILWEEIRFVAQKFSEHCKADKMNIAALGNIVPQLHIHIIARFKNDPAWPNPIWNSGIPATQYPPHDGARKTTEIQRILGV